ESGAARQFLFLAGGQRGVQFQISELAVGKPALGHQADLVGPAAGSDESIVGNRIAEEKVFNESLLGLGGLLRDVESALRRRLAWSRAGRILWFNLVDLLGNLGFLRLFLLLAHFLGRLGVEAAMRASPE